jgi:hypothetical protein
MLCWKIVKKNKEARLKLRKILALDALVETGESRTQNMAPTVAHALRDLSGALARLADTLDEASSNSLEP